jgi:hypothetical protein
MVFFDFRTNTKLKLPDDLREKIQRLKNTTRSHALPE